LLFCNKIQVIHKPEPTILYQIKLVDPISRRDTYFKI